MRNLANVAVILALVLSIAPTEAWSAPGGGWLQPWSNRIPITITNTSGTDLTNFQVKIALGSSFDFSKAKADGSDVRMTAGDGATQIPFWIESWNTKSQAASIWVQVPSVPTTGTTIYLYFGNASAASASDGNATFLFFDDFESKSQGQGYWTLGSPQTELVQDQAWETSAPHTLSVLNLSMGGHTYWGYYGLQGVECGGVGLAFSEDLVTWTKYPGNPLFSNGRWPTVVKLGSLLYMVHTKNYCGTSELDLATSTDGIIWTDIKQLVPPDYLGRPRNQNPNLWLNPNDGKYYLYWYNGDDSSVWNILARNATSPTGLDSASTEVNVLSSPAILAAPNMMFSAGTYFLSTEVKDNSGLWNVKVYSSTSGPTAGFTPLPGNPVLNNGAACMFQTIFGAIVHEYYCKLTGATWTLEHREADLSATRPLFPILDPAKWTSVAGSWYLVPDIQQNGTAGMVAQGRTSAHQILQSTFAGTDYVLEAYGKQISGRVWGLGFRVSDPDNFYSINLYNDLNGTQNLYSYSWVNNNGTLPSTTLGTAAVGTVNANTWYKLSVRAQGSTFEIYKDDIFQIHTSDASHVSGGVALYGEAGTVANFNNVLVRKFASADPTPALGSVEINQKKKHHPGDDDDHDDDHDRRKDRDHPDKHDDHEDGRGHSSRE